MRLVAIVVLNWHRAVGISIAMHVNDEDKGTVAIRDTAFASRLTLINESGQHGKGYMGANCADVPRGKNRRIYDQFMVRFMVILQV